MRVLYIGAYRDGTGWAHAAIDYILAMDSVGIDVVCRPVKLNAYPGELPARVLELEAKPLKDCDICIQHVLPHMAEYNGKFKKNIVLYATETSNFRRTTWPEKINEMDEAWVISEQSRQASIDSGVKIPIFKINHAINTNKFLQSFEPLQFDSLDLSDHFVFYFIGETTRRKNIAALIKAFHTEFAKDEPVSLLIKCGSNADEINKLQSYVQEIKTGLKLYSNIDSYKKDLLISGDFSEENILRLHSTCHCFVMPSYGEAWNIPAAEAMTIGNTPIVTDGTGMNEYINDNVGYLVPSHDEPCFGVMDTFSDLYTAQENWKAIDVLKLAKTMRHVFENKEERTKKGLLGITRAYDFSYESIGNQIKERLLCTQ